MIKKGFYLVLSVVLLIVLSGCPDEEKSAKDETEQIPNTMEKASAEIEQIITLLGGPIFDSRDRIDQLKNEQMQMLVSRTENKPEQSTTGSDKTEQNQKEEESGKNEGEEESQKDQMQGDEQGQDKQKKEQQSGEGEQEKKEQSDEGGQESDKSSGEKGKKESEGEQQENVGEEQDVQRPSPPEKGEKPFHFEDSLFGIPQWNDENWKMIKVLTDGMYFTWNNLQPLLLEKGIPETQGESFNEALENLSRSVRDKSIQDAQASVYTMYRSLAEFFSFFKTEKPPELQRIKAMVTGIHFSVRQSNWEISQELSNQLQQDFIKVKTGVEDDQTGLVKMLEISLNDLRSAIQKQDALLVMIRTNLVTSNIEELDAKLSEQKPKEH